MAWNDPRTWVTGETVTATHMNQHVRDNFKAIGDPWGNFTATWTAVSSNPVVGNGGGSATFFQAGKLVFYAITLTMGTSTTYGSGPWLFALPVAAKRQMSCGDVRLYDSSATTNLSGSAFIEPSLTTLRPLHSSGSVAATSPFTWADGDVIMIAGAYEAA